eukprot:g11184.t1
MGRLAIPFTWILIVGRVLIAAAEDTFIDVTLTRGTTGLGVHLVSEAKGKGAVIDRVVPGSAASLFLRAGDVLITISGVDVEDWYLDNITRLLGRPDPVKVQVRRPPEPQLHPSDVNIATKEIGAEGTKTASCYASVEGDTEDLHAFACTPATFGADLPVFSVDGPAPPALPVVVAQPLELCTTWGSAGLNSEGAAAGGGGGFALLVSKGGCLAGVKARNAALSKAEVMILVDGQFPPLPPLPSVSGAKTPPDVSGSLSARSQARKADIPVLVVANSTGHRIMSEAQDLGREVLIVAHAGTRPSRSTRSPRKQIPLADSEGLRIPEEAFNMASSFRDGQVLVDFGEPGPPSGASPNTFKEVSLELRSLLAANPKTFVHLRSSSDYPGVSTAKHDHSHEVQQTLKTTCSHCHGFGEVAKKGKACPRCRGGRVVHERALLELTVPRGAPEGHRISFPGNGSHFPGTAAGSVEVVLKTKPHESFTREGANLRTEIPINLTEALSGFTRSIQLLNGTFLALNKTGVTSNNGVIEVQGAGLPVWDPAGPGKKTRAAFGASGRTESGIPSLIPPPEPPEEHGSLLISCKVVFPESLSRRGGRLSGLEIAGAEEDDDG